MVTVQCCWCSLRTGSLLIAVWSIISSTFVIALGSWAIETIKNNEEIRILLILAVTLSALELLFGALLLLGVVKKNLVLLKTWLVFQAVFLVISILGFGVLLCSNASFSNKVKEFVSIGLTVYCVLVVYNYHNQLLDEYNCMSPVSLRGTSLGDNAPPLPGKVLPRESITYTATSDI